MAANEFCKNCEQPKSKHQQEYVMGLIATDQFYCPVSGPPCEDSYYTGVCVTFL